MLTILDDGCRLCDGLTRREWIRAGGIGLGGLSLAGLLKLPHAAAADGGSGRAFGKAKSVILFGLTGGPAQQETWDPKPEGPSETRGEFAAIPTKTPGLNVCELMPETAKWTDRIAVLRAVVTNDSAHSTSGYQMLTGVPHIPPQQESVTAKPPNLWPSMGAIVRTLRRGGSLPSAVTIPEHIWNDGNFPWPGQDAGFLGQQYDPWLIKCDPSEETFNVPDLALPQEISPLRFDQRRTLLEQVNRHLDALDRTNAVARYSDEARQAFGLLSGSKSRDAFDLGRESDKVRDRYGRSRFAQSVLLARRLVEAGVSLVQINWTRIKDQPNQGGWDTHAKHSESMKKLLMPMMDQCFTALLEDLSERGLLDETLVVWFGEFGRTPRFNGNAGRDHWGKCFSLALAGGGIRGGQVHGESDEQAAYPVGGIVEAKDLTATVFHCLGYTPETLMHDTLGRPLAISRGDVIEQLF